MGGTHKAWEGRFNCAVLEDTYKKFSQASWQQCKYCLVPWPDRCIYTVDYDGGYDGAEGDFPSTPCLLQGSCRVGDHGTQIVETKYGV